MLSHVPGFPRYSSTGDGLWGSRTFTYSVNQIVTTHLVSGTL
jgi:hypothetical protein